MAVEATESDCVEFVSSTVPTVTGYVLFPSFPLQPQNTPVRSSRPCRLSDASYVSSGLIFDARNERENHRIPTSSATEIPNPNFKKTSIHMNSMLARHPGNDSNEFIELWSDSPSKNANHLWNDQKQMVSENDSALMSSFVTDSEHDCSQLSCVLNKYPWTASKEFVEPWSDIPSECNTSRNRYNHAAMMGQNSHASVSNAIADSKYDSCVISWDLSKYPWTATKDFVVLWSDIPSEFDLSWNRYEDQEELIDQNNLTSASNVIADSKRDCSEISCVLNKHPWTASEEFVEQWSDTSSEYITSRNRYKDHAELMDQNNRRSVSNAVSDSKYDSSVMYWDLRKQAWTATKDFLVLRSDMTSECDPSQNRYEDQGELMDQNNRASVSNAVPDSKYDSSVISWDPSKHPWTAIKDFVVMWSDIPSEFDSQNRYDDQGELIDQNGAAPSSLSRDTVDREPCLSAHPGVFRNSCIESENLTEVSIIAKDDSMSNKDYVIGPEKNKSACCRIFSECVCHFATSFKNHICYLVMITLFSSIPISALYMGFGYFGTCPASVVVSHLVYVNGIAGVILIGSRIRSHFVKETLKEDWKRVSKTFLIIIAILLLTEMLFFYTMSSSAFEKSENYCDETYYYYIFYMNIVAAGIVYLLVLLEYTSLKHLVEKLPF